MTPWDRIADGTKFPEGCDAEREKLRQKVKRAVQKAARECYLMGEWARYYRIASNPPKRPPSPVRDWMDAAFFVEDKYKVKV